MPSSDPLARVALIKHVQSVAMPMSILDLGVGMGNYGSMFKSAFPDCKIYGVEIWAPYMATFKSQVSCYEKVYISDIRYFDYKFVDAELVIAGDVLEHMPKIDCIELINRLKDRYKWIVISLPIQRFEQGAENEYGNIYEAHLYHWTKEEVQNDLGFEFIAQASVCGIFEYEDR